MKRQSTEVVCDECGEHSPLEAVIACEVHSVDLCEIHLRKHFNREVCRLVDCPTGNVSTRLGQSFATGPS
jgi:hypothetical protein